MLYQPDSEPYGSESYHRSIWCFHVQIWFNKSCCLIYFFFYKSSLFLRQWSSSPQYNADHGHGSSESTHSWDPCHFHQVLHYTNPPRQHAPCPEGRPWLTGLVVPSDVTLQHQWGGRKCSGPLHSTATLGRQVNAQCGQSWGLCCTGHQWTSKYHVGELVTLWTELFFCNFLL